MRYIKDGVYPITEQQIRQNHPNTSFPRPMELHHAAEFGYELVHDTAPAHDPATEVATEGAPEFALGQWEQTWIVTSRPVVIPTVVSMRRARLALLGAGLLDSVNAAVAAMIGPTGEAARIEWEYATEVDRNSPLVSGLAGMLALTPVQLDGLFTAAATL